MKNLALIPTILFPEHIFYAKIDAYADPKNLRPRGRKRSRS